MTLHAEMLSMENISKNIKKDLETSIKGQNKRIIDNIYKQTGFKPLWIGNKNAKRASSLIQALNDPLFNYKDKPFDRKAISRLYYLLDNTQPNIQKQSMIYAKLDLVLTSSMVRLVRFIVQGDVDWDLVQKKLYALKESDDIQADWEMEKKMFPDQRELISAIVNNDIYNYLSYLIPMEERYKKLVQMLKDYRRMDEFPKVPYTGEVIKLGHRSKHIVNIKRRLQITGDFPKNVPLNREFDEVLKQAVISYQKRYLLKVTGEIDSVTNYYLNQPNTTNIQAIITNLDKTKLYPKKFEKEHIEVNIPDFTLRYYKDNKRILKKGAVVGRIDRPTPLFSDKMTYMVLNPTWTITDNLIKRDLIPVLRDEPDYLEENNIRVFRGKKEVEVSQEMLDPYENSEKLVPFRFVQYPGDNNALGRVKFMFPNKYDVYIHDTNEKSLLERRYKIYSSGCMRIEQPFDLVNILLKNNKRKYNIEKILKTDQPKTIGLSKPIPVHMLYFTVYEEDGLAYFKNDIYMYDKIIEESTEDNRKETFVLPDKRMIAVDQNARKRVTN